MHTTSVNFTILVMVLYFYAEVVSASPLISKCTDLFIALQPQFVSQKLAVNKGVASSELKETFRSLGISEFNNSTPESFIQALGIDLNTVPQIVLLSFTNFLGDNMVFYFSLIDYLRKTYPKIPIRIISPKAGILNSDPQLGRDTATFPVRFLEYHQKDQSNLEIRNFTRRMPGFLKSQILPGAFVFYDLTTLDKAEEQIGRNPAFFSETADRMPRQELARVLTDLSATGLGLSVLKSGFLTRKITGLEWIPNTENAQTKATFSSANGSELLYSRGGNPQGVRLTSLPDFSTDNVYESWLRSMALLFGESVYLTWDPKDYVRLENEKRADDFLARDGRDANRPFVILNFNTMGINKIRELTPIYFEVLKTVVDHLLSEFPNIDVVIPFPEAQFGPEVQDAFMDYSYDKKERVLLLTASDRDLTPNLMLRAQLIASSDSGLVHLAAFVPEDKVLTFSLSRGDAKSWRKPKQNFVALSDGATPQSLAAQINGWLDSKLKINKKSQILRRIQWLFR